MPLTNKPGLMSDTAKIAEMKIDSSKLYRDETYTDQTIGSIRCLIPVTADGSADTSRATIYIGQAQMMTGMGPIPLTFEIEADNLQQACEKFGPAAQAAVEKTIEEAKELQRQQASSIVVPGQNGGMGGMGGMGGGSVPGGGLKLP